MSAAASGWIGAFLEAMADGIISDDDSGHGTHVQSVIASSAMEADGTFQGIAPYAHLVSVKAFDANGQGSYADVIRGIDWVVANKERYKVRVLNCSFSAPPQSHYWDDPLNQAVMNAWSKGLVVVAGAKGTASGGSATLRPDGSVPQRRVWFTEGVKRTVERRAFSEHVHR